MSRIELVRRAAAWLTAALCLLRVGLFGMYRYARRFAAALCLLAAFVLPVGYINPLNAMDHGVDAPVSHILLWMVPAEIGLLGLAWALDPPLTGPTGRR